MNLTTRFLNWLFRRRAPRSKVILGIELAQKHGIPKERVQTFMSFAIANYRDNYPDVFYKMITNELDEPYNDH